MSAELCRDLRDQLKAMMETGKMVTVVVRTEACYGIPPEFNSPVTLNLGYNLPFPTDDLDINLVGLSATLTFNRQPSVVIIPWAAVLGIRGPEVPSVEPQTTLDLPEPPPKPRPSHLSVVKG